VRAAHADREQVIEVLKGAFVQGRLTGDELDARLSQVLASRTYAELAALTADIPVDLVWAQSRRAGPRAKGSRPPMTNAAKVAICLMIVAVTLLVSYFADTYAFAMFTFFYFLASIVAGAQILSWRHQKRSGPRRGPRAP
jgi:Domain of unknown function (DUF1707)